MRTKSWVLAGLVAAACTPTVPESGVGFGDYSEYLRQREQALATGSAAPVAPLPGSVPGSAAAVPPRAAAPGGFSTDRAAAAIAAAEGGGATPAAGGAVTGAVIGAERPRGDAPLTIKPETGEAATIAALNGGAGGSGTISDEQDFAAVSARETIASDAERIARNRAQYEVVQPTALPSRPAGDSGAGLVGFALGTTHAPGTPVYRRSGLRGGDAAGRCARYASADIAQEDFLAAGGPERDRKGLDPDGDGFVCGWDPRPFRAARQ
jgi:hypothetical protein